MSKNINNDVSMNPPIISRELFLWFVERTAKIENRTRISYRTEGMAVSVKFEPDV